MREEQGEHEVKSNRVMHCDADHLISLQWNLVEHSVNKAGTGLLRVVSHATNAIWKLKGCSR